MRHAVILAGGAGVRLWPMSRAAMPKQLVPLLEGKSLLQLAAGRLDGLVPPGNRLVCSAQKHVGVIAQALAGWSADQFLGEPVGRDTLAAIGFSATVLARRDPEAVFAVFPADHVIKPIGRFQEALARGFELAERQPETLVTFGIAPSSAATAYGYLELGEPVGGSARAVVRFREKPDATTAATYLEAGPERYLWNSGIFVWRARTLLDCIRRYEPELAEGLARIGQAWGASDQNQVLGETYPALKKISIDYAVMEPASRDPLVRVAAIPMAVDWLDVGSWPAFGRTCPQDEHGNALAAARHLLLDTCGTLVASNEPEHLIAAVGCGDLVIVHTRDATLVCRADQAERLKELNHLLREKFGDEYL